MSKRLFTHGAGEGSFPSMGSLVNFHGPSVKESIFTFGTGFSPSWVLSEDSEDSSGVTLLDETERKPSCTGYS